MVPMTPWVRNLLIANVAAHLLVPAGSGIWLQGAFLGSEMLTHPWTLLTYQFLHAPGFGHIFFNMLALYFFGPRLEERLGAGNFLALYLGAGVFGAVLSAVFTPQALMVGASAAVYGVVAAFAVVWPFEKVYLWFVLPVPIWALAIFMVVFSLQSSVVGVNDGIAHFAHLGGLIFGGAYLKIWEYRTGSALRSFQKKMQMPSGDAPRPIRDRGAVARWEEIDVSDLHEINRVEVEQLMARVRAEGASTLTTSERQFLDRMAGR
ncbi:MAG TPA: rhomboid family intramembrane serine protease [Longimicrobiales bacterium]|nr:rhomboid family intramembrane serine protease [Longimicrobiales bacterium]